MNKRGFSIVELIVVITIISILLALAVVSFRNYQVDARNVQRQDRAENIARYIEALHNTGSTNPVVTQGVYPHSQSIVNNTYTAEPSVAKLESLFGKNGFDLTNLKSAGKDSYGLKVSTAAYDSPPTTATMTPDQYIYQPLYYNNNASATITRCYSATVGRECRIFVLYYMTEGDNVIHKIPSIHS